MKSDFAEASQQLNKKMEKEAKYPDTQAPAFLPHHKQITTLPFIKETFGFYLEKRRG